MKTGIRQEVREDKRKSRRRRRRRSETADPNRSSIPEAGKMIMMPLHNESLVYYYLLRTWLEIDLLLSCNVINLRPLIHSIPFASSFVWQNCLWLSQTWVSWSCRVRFLRLAKVLSSVYVRKHHLLKEEFTWKVCLAFLRVSSSSSSTVTSRQPDDWRRRSLSLSR